MRYLAPFAVSALRAWLDTANIPAGCLFRRVRPKGVVSNRPLTDHEVARIFKRLARRVGVGGVEAAGIDCYRKVATDGVREARRARAPASPSPGEHTDVRTARPSQPGPGTKAGK